jgi:E3 ubiquitin-protein ligase mind-bomb
LFFIALQYLPTKSKLFDSFDGIDIINGVNKTGETALHLALYGEKWQIAEEIFRKFKNFDVNSTNVLRDTPLHLAAKLKNCEISLFKKILHRTNSENVNKADGNGWTALHSAIDRESEIKVRKLLNHKDVDVTIKNKDNNSTTLHLASKWPKIPADLFQMIFKKSTDLINAHNEDGNTALHLAIMTKFESAAKKLLAHKDVNVDAKNNEMILALHRACICKNIPMDLFKIVLNKSTDVNAQDEYGHTALHYAILHQSKTHVEELLAHKDVNVNVKNVKNQTALHLACKWKKDMPMDLFKFILEKTVDINAQDIDGWTALHWAIAKKFDTKVKELLAHSDVDVNIKGEFNYTPLHLTCEWTDIPVDLFQIILDKSTSDTINAQTKNGHTALHLAFLNSLEEADKKQQQYCC